MSKFVDEYLSFFLFLNVFDLLPQIIKIKGKPKR